MAAFSEGAWENAIASVCGQFGIESVFPDQFKAINAFFNSSLNLFVSLATGSGKSLIFQSLPTIADCLYSKPRGSSILVVISPLQALMEDQVNYLQNLGFPAIAIMDGVADDPEILQQVINGVYTHVYGSPECLLASKSWRDIFSSTTFLTNLIGVAIDEAHCIVQWGLPGPRKVPFRKWYGCLGEITSLIPKQSKLVILTATATKATKTQILETLHINSSQLYSVECSPDRPNLMYVVKYLDKELPIEDIFYTLIKEIEVKKVQTGRTIVYCQTRKQCSILFRMFEVFLGSNMYHDAICAPKNRFVEMFHAGTPKLVKQHITQNMSINEGRVRVLIATIAFGMGVNCKKVRRTVHFGPSKSIEQFVQESGRAGRDGEQSVCLLLFNGLLTSHCERDMKDFLQAEGCRRQMMMKQFGFSNEAVIPLHRCCNVCVGSCDCEDEDCGRHWYLAPREEEDEDLHMSTAPVKEAARTRPISNSNKELLKERLIRYQKAMVRNSRGSKLVSCPNILFEFNTFQVQQVLANCHKLFTIKDIMSKVEIWRTEYAHAVLEVIAEIFGDIDNAEFNNMCENNSLASQDSHQSAWGQLRNDSSFLSLFDSHVYEDLMNGMDNMEQSNPDSDISQTSSIFESLIGRAQNT